MLKVCTSYSKKVPTDQQYSSQQFHASVEVELSDALSPDQLQERIHQTFSVVRSTVEAEITGKPTNGNGGHPAEPKTNGKASNAQIKFITDLAGQKNIKLGELNQGIKEVYGVESLYELTKKDASALLDQLRRGTFRIPTKA